MPDPASLSLSIKGRLWLVRYILRWCRGIAAKIANGRWTFRICGTLLGAYHLCLDVRGDDAWITDYPKTHGILFYGLLIFTLIFSFTFSKRKDDAQEISNSILTGFIRTVGTVVETKIRRFRSKLKNLKVKTNKFDEITHPKEQLAIIAEEAVAFLSEFCGLNDNQVDIRIIHRKLPSGGWAYEYCYQSWTHSDLNTRLAQGSAGYSCITTGERVFFPDKNKAHLLDKYELSKRDKERGAGSVYIYPTVIEAPDANSQYVISIITYSATLCDPSDQNDIDVTESILREFCRRMELELCLTVIKSVKWPQTKKETHAPASSSAEPQ